MKSKVPLVNKATKTKLEVQKEADTSSFIVQVENTPIFEDIHFPSNKVRSCELPEVNLSPYGLTSTNLVIEFHEYLDQRVFQYFYEWMQSSKINSGLHVGSCNVSILDASGTIITIYVYSSFYPINIKTEKLDYQESKTMKQVIAFNCNFKGITNPSHP